ncbi:pro-neuregulin-2, membrane-bound isoform-like isoform X2 [Myxocyprinus asiaticus]|uniref:pro-neuregulin-2, membrane-bound isoform-like isoform X2 n=1 Tax=Myxocyprinus asiaticus TaxID=70543 RepID=UPI0022234879|nr:pro-neuregulin-2, membrane-bound isoform-like isoform X2 [Myxocyprinus asiaticus]
MRSLGPVHFSMLVIGVSFACYAPSLDSLQDQAYRSAVVIEGEVSALPVNVSVEPYSVNVKVLDVWPVNSGGLERDQLVTVGEFGSEAPCVAVEKNHRYIFFMDPTEEPLVFKASFAPLDTNEKNLKKDVESILCEDCASAPKVKPMDSQLLLEGRKLTLKCDATGNPSPSFNWYKDGSQLRKRKDVKIKSNKKNSKLHINRVRLEDSGNYTCVVENSLGRENATSYVNIQSITTTLSPGSSHARKCNETEKTYCVNGGDCYFINGINQLSCKCPNDYTGERCQTSVMAGFYKAEELYQKRVLTITGICVALLIVGILCVVAYCKTKKQRKKMHNHLHQNMCTEHSNRMLANGPNHPGPVPEEIPMVEYISKNVPATERVIRQGTETSGNFSGSQMSSRSHHTSTASHASSHRHEERTWSMERTDSIHSDCQSGPLSSSIGTSKCSSPACMEARARRAAYFGYPDTPQCPLQYGDSYDSLRDSPHSDRYVSALTTPARLSPVDFHSSLPPQVPTFQITTPNANHALSLPPATSAVAMGAYSPDDNLPLLHHYRRSRRPYYAAESTGSLPSSPYRFVDDEDYETTQEYMSSREQPKKSNTGHRWHRRSQHNGHVSQHASGSRNFSSQSCLSDSEWEDDEVGDLGHGESTPFLSMQNMNTTEPVTICRPNDTRTYSNTGRSGSHGNVPTNKLSQSRSRPNNAPL